VIVQKIALTNFRNFSDWQHEITHSTVFVIGSNGSGKTAVCEALYYGCFARSFKTHTPRELIQFGAAYATIVLTFEGRQGPGVFHAGMDGTKKIIKINEKQVTTARQLMTMLPVVIFSEFDMNVVTGGPRERRTFIDQYLLLSNPDYVHALHTLGKIVDQRNALLQKSGIRDQAFLHWSRVLWQHSCTIQEQRRNALANLMNSVNELTKDAPFSWHITASYQPREELGTDFDVFWRENQALFLLEERQRKTLFGAHVDDSIFFLNDRPARLFSSRGQQKLLVFLLKCAVIQLLKETGEPPLFILDDIMVDFDDQRIIFVANILKHLGCQLFITSTMATTALNGHFEPHTAQKITLGNF
jgi:DNA replication and repair protein RecF